MRRSWSSLSRPSVLDASGAVGQPTSRVVDCIGGKVKESVQLSQSKAKIVAVGELVTKRSFAMVYGLKGIVPRLHPLSKRLLEFERVLRERDSSGRHKDGDHHLQPCG